MTILTTTFQTSQLDFDGIKESLKLYLRRMPEFADYDFEASGLSNILDVLAYNTHINALMANFSLNEAYLGSAQLRSSIVNIAQTLGYNIRSRSAAAANLRLTVNLSSAFVKPTSIVLPAGTKFSTSIDGISYIFQTRSSYTAYNNSGIYVFISEDGSESIPVYEGILRTKTFIVQSEDERQIFVIPDNTIDTRLVNVNVYATYNSSLFTSYTSIFGVTNINPLSTHYRIIESPNGFYELNFGDGITTGKKPAVGNKVIIDYLATAGAAGNGAISFNPISQITINAVNYDIGVSLISASYGGSDKQSIESIRANAPLGFAAQQRLVTAEDYKTTILTSFSSVNDVVAWGGEDNDPPNYGVVYVGLLFNDNISASAQTAVKNSIKANLNENLAVLSIDVAFVDPVITYLNIATQFEFNPNLTGFTQNTVENQVLTVIRNYVETNLQTFSGTFRKSNLATLIDEMSVAILSTKIDVSVQQRLTPITTATADDTSQLSSYTVSFPVPLSSPDDINYIITSSLFFYNGVTCSIKNKLGTTKLQIVDANNIVIIDNIGQYIPTTGKISLVGFAPGLISSGETFIKINALPANDSVLKPLRNYYFDMDLTTSFASANIDRQTTRVQL